jgi:LmbE family N-acetylglucosaminyl deacetylase
MEEWSIGPRNRSVIQLSLPGRAKDPFQVLCLGAHSDDVEIGCGGTLLKLKNTFPRLKFHWVVFHAPGARGEEAARAAELFTAGCQKEVVLKHYRDGFLPYKGSEIKGFFEELKGQVNPDLIFTHWQGDAHQDHRFVAELTWNTFRDHLILEYEIPKYDGDLGRPSVFVPLNPPLHEKKIEYLLDSFVSQRSKRWFDRDTFLGLMRIRGMECNAESGFAEAFHARKIVL